MKHLSRALTRLQSSATVTTELSSGSPHEYFINSTSSSLDVQYSQTDIPLETLQHSTPFLSYCANKRSTSIKAVISSYIRLCFKRLSAMTFSCLTEGPYLDDQFLSSLTPRSTSFLSSAVLSFNKYDLDGLRGGWVSIASSAIIQSSQERRRSLNRLQVCRHPLLCSELVWILQRFRC